METLWAILEIMPEKPLFEADPDADGEVNGVPAGVPAPAPPSPRFDDRLGELPSCRNSFRFFVGVEDRPLRPTKGNVW